MYDSCRHYTFFSMASAIVSSVNLIPVLNAPTKVFGVSWSKTDVDEFDDYVAELKLKAAEVAAQLHAAKERR